MFNLGSLSDTLWLAYKVDNSNVKISLEIKISSELNVNPIKIIYFKRRSATGLHYAEAAFTKIILWLFSHVNFTHERITQVFNPPWTILHLLKCTPEKKIRDRKKNKTWKNLTDFFFSQNSNIICFSHM